MGLFDKKQYITYPELNRELDQQRRQGKLSQKEFDYLTGYFKPMSEKKSGYISEADFHNAMKFLEREWRDPVRDTSVKQLKQIVSKGPASNSTKRG